MKGNVLITSFIPSAVPVDQRLLQTEEVPANLMTTSNMHEAQIINAYTISCNAGYSYTSYF